MGGPSFCAVLALPVARPGVLVVRVYPGAFLTLSGLPGRSGASGRGLVLRFPGGACRFWRVLWRSAGFWSRGAIDDRLRVLRAFLGLLGAF